MSGSKKFFLILTSTLLVLIIVCFSFRNYFLNQLLQKKIKSFNTKYEADASIEKASFSGFSSVVLENISVKGLSQDTLFTSDSIQVDIRLISLLKGNLRPDYIFITNSRIHLIKKQSKNNYSFLLKKRLPKDTTEATSVNYAEKFNNGLDLLFDIIPNKLHVRSVSLELEKDSLNLKAYLPSTTFSENSFNADIKVNELNSSTTWNLKGSINKADQTANVSIIPEKGNLQSVPLLKNMFGFKFAFDSLNFALDKKDFDSDRLNLKGSSSSCGLLLNHWRISAKDVFLPISKFNYSITATEDQLFLDTNSVAIIEKLPLKVSARYKPGKSKEIGLQAAFNNVPSKDFFDALPLGLFEDVKGIKATGSLSYAMKFDVSLNKSDSVKFTSALTKKDFKITKFGKTNFSEVNGEFSHTAYDKDKPVKTFMVGPSNPMFTPIDNISIYLRSALLTSEDGNFFSHNGFNEEAFRKSIAENIKEKRFVRGGSTISMQLVKNLFLTRSKTVSRKIEEALIAWLIENNRLISKQRMYEIYLNIIEWGPGVYGIGEASQFYFEKLPSELTLEESIFLAMIVPRPKAFKYQFDERGNLKPHTQAYFNLIAAHLLKKGIITEEEKLNLKYTVDLKGPARAYFKELEDATVEREEEDLLF